MSTQDNFALRSCLDLALQVMALRQDLTDLKALVDSMRTTKSDPKPAVKSTTGYLSGLVKFFETKLGQAIIAIGTPAMVALVKWLMGSS